MSSTINALTTGGGGIAVGGDSSGQIALQSNGTTYATGNQYGIGLGTAVPSSGIGIAFPATQSPSSDANTLDDYEEGTWTPSLVGSGGSSGQAYSTRVGRYVKIGQMVWVSCDVNLTTGGTNSGSYAWVSGFPFTAASVGGIAFSPVSGYFANFGVSSVTVGGEMDAGYNYMYITYTTGAAGSPTFAAASYLQNNCRLTFQGCYIAST